MELLILIAIIAVGASALYVAATFNARTEQKIDPLRVDVKKDIREQNEKTREKLERQIQAIADQLQEVTNRELEQQIQAIADERAAASEELRKQIQAIAGQLQEVTNRELEQQIQAIADERAAASEGLRKQIQAITGQLLRDRELVRNLYERIDKQQNQLGRDLLQLDHRVAQLSESLAQQSAKITEIHRYAKSQGAQAGSSPQMDSLVLAMLEAESHVDRKAWGKPPHLYALTATTSPIAADHELPAEIRDARPGALIPVEQEPLPEGDLIEALANIHWPEDVVGCVLVTELTALPPKGEEDAPIDPAAGEQWSSTRPDGRPARLAVGVCRNGAYTCGFRIKGEDDVQVGTERADDLVTALLGTF